MGQLKDRGYCERLHCSQETKDRIMTDCVNEYLKHHPEMRGINITQGFILDRISKHYVESIF